MKRQRERKLVLHLGALAPRIMEQIQGFDALEAVQWQAMADAITLLSVQGLLGDAASRRARSKLADLIATNPKVRNR